MTPAVPSICPAPVQVALQERDAVQQRCVGLQRQLEEAGQKAVLEMSHVEARVRATLQKKDEQMAALREQVIPNCQRQNWAAFGNPI